MHVCMPCMVWWLQYDSLIWLHAAYSLLFVIHHGKPVYSLSAQLDMNVQISSAVLLTFSVQARCFSKRPLVVWDGDLEGPFKTCIVHIEDQMLKTSHPKQAILLAFCLHWAFVLIYQWTLKNFYSLMENLLGLAATKAMPMINMTVVNTWRILQMEEIRGWTYRHSST